MSSRSEGRTGAERGDSTNSTRRQCRGHQEYGTVERRLANKQPRAEAKDEAVFVETMGKMDAVFVERDALESESSPFVHELLIEIGDSWLVVNIFLNNWDGWLVDQYFWDGS